MSELYQKKVKPYLRHIGTLAMCGAQEKEIAAMLGIGHFLSVPAAIRPRRRLPSARERKMRMALWWMSRW